MIHNKNSSQANDYFILSVDDTSGKITVQIPHANFAVTAYGFYGQLFFEIE